jgi:hypothetical protein
MHAERIERYAAAPMLPEHTQPSMQQSVRLSACQKSWVAAYLWIHVLCATVLLAQTSNHTLTCDNCTALASLTILPTYGLLNSEWYIVCTVHRSVQARVSLDVH